MLMNSRLAVFSFKMPGYETKMNWQVDLEALVHAKQYSLRYP